MTVAICGWNTQRFARIHLASSDRRYADGAQAQTGGRRLRSRRFATVPRGDGQRSGLVAGIAKNAGLYVWKRRTQWLSMASPLHEVCSEAASDMGLFPRTALPLAGAGTIAGATFSDADRLEEMVNWWCGTVGGVLLKSDWFNHFVSISKRRRLMIGRSLSSRMGIRESCIAVLTLIFPALSEAQQQSSQTFWEHNGSTVYLLAKGETREFYYHEPRPGMIAAGARQGTLLFSGISSGGGYSGTAYIFRAGCGRFPYQVSGPILDDYERVVLQGQAPRVGANCRIQGYFTDMLEFSLIKSKNSFSRSVTSFEADRPITDSFMSVPLQREGGIYVVPVLINDAITLNFVVDSGAAHVTIPADVVMTLIRTGTIKSSDFLGEQTYILADGSRVPSQTFRIRSLKIGSRVLENVIGSVADVKGSLLLGQSFLGRFESWSIDNASNRLLLK